MKTKEWPNIFCKNYLPDIMKLGHKKPFKFRYDVCLKN